MKKPVVSRATRQIIQKPHDLYPKQVRTYPKRVQQTIKL